MLLQGKIVRNLLIGMTLLNLVLIGFFFYASAKWAWLLGDLFPGKFGPGLSPEFTGNFVVLSLLLLVNALVITLVGFKDTLHAMWAGMRLSPKTMRRFLNEKAGLASDISGVVAAAVQEEEKLELGYIDRAGWVLRVGLVLFALALPALGIAMVRANAGGAPMFANDGIAVPNSNVSNEEIWRFTGDQVAASLLLGIPEVYHLRASPLDANTPNLAFTTLVWIFRILIGFGVLLSIIATLRMRALWRYAMEVAMPVRDIVAMEPALAAGREHTEYRHSSEEPRWQDHNHRRDEPVAVVDEPRYEHHDNGAGHDRGNGHDHANSHTPETHRDRGNARETHDDRARPSAYDEEVRHREETVAHNGHEHDHTGQHHGGHTGEPRHHTERRSDDSPRTVRSPRFLRARLGAVLSCALLVSGCASEQDIAARTDHRVEFDTADSLRTAYNIVAEMALTCWTREYAPNRRAQILSKVDEAAGTASVSQVYPMMLSTMYVANVAFASMPSGTHIVVTYGGVLDNFRDQAQGVQSWVSGQHRCF